MDKKDQQHVRSLFENELVEYGTVSFAQLAAQSGDFLLLDDRGLSDTSASAGLDAITPHYKTVYFSDGELDGSYYDESDVEPKCAYYRELFGTNSNFHSRSSNTGLSMKEASLHLTEQITGPAGKVVAVERADIIEDL